jgi:YggT family protein
MAYILVAIQALVVLAWLVVLGRVLMSWIDPRLERPISRTLYGLTEPVLAPVRRVLPQTGSLDLSPLLVLLGLGILMRVVQVG